MSETGSRVNGDEMKVFGRPVLGGGIKLVFPSVSGPEEPVIEVKVETFLADPRKLFVEVAGVWDSPTPLDEAVGPEETPA